MSLWHPQRVEAIPAQTWEYPTRTLAFEEIYDGTVAAGAAVTPTVTGVFSCALQVAELDVELYSDSLADWFPLVTLVRGIGAVVGEANKIRFQNTDTTTRWMVVNRYG